MRIVFIESGLLSLLLQAESANFAVLAGVTYILINISVKPVTINNHIINTE